MYLNISEFAKEIYTYISRLVDQYATVENPHFLADASWLAQNLPSPLRRSLLDFKLQEKDAVCHITGYPVDDKKLGPTPGHWNDRESLKHTEHQNFYLTLCAHVIGETVAWATEQGGNLIHEVFPIRGNEGGQLGTSTDKLEWHTEDAFHPERMDYVALMCLRNPDETATTYASVSDLILDDETCEELSRPAYPFFPDEGNRADTQLTPKETGLVAELIRKSHARVQDMFYNPKLVEVLFGNPTSPYLRVHPYYIGDFGADFLAQRAFEKLKLSINAALNDVVLQPGDLFFIDNYRAVHGRREVPGHFDGTDRWLKRAFIVRDLRKTRALRVSANARVVY